MMWLYFFYCDKPRSTAANELSRQWVVHGMVGSMLCHAEQRAVRRCREFKEFREFREFKEFRESSLTSLISLISLISLFHLLHPVTPINTINTTPTPCYCDTMLLCYSERTPQRADRTSAHGINIAVYSHYYTPLYDHLNGYINNNISIYGSIGVGMVLSPYCPYYSLLSAQYSDSKYSEY